MIIPIGINFGLGQNDSISLRCDCKHNSIINETGLAKVITRIIQVFLSVGVGALVLVADAVILFIWNAQGLQLFGGHSIGDSSVLPMRSFKYATTDSCLNLAASDIGVKPHLSVLIGSCLHFSTKNLTQCCGNGNVNQM